MSNEIDRSRLTLKVEEAAKLLGISRGLAYRLANTGELPILKFGHRILVPRRALEKLLDEAGDAREVNNAKEKEK